MIRTQKTMAMMAMMEPAPELVFGGRISDASLTRMVTWPCPDPRALMASHTKIVLLRPSTVEISR